MTFSIVVPVYNVEDYIQECIESILKQTEKSYELVLMDDCSSDSSGTICDKYAEKYPEKIRAYHSSVNEGLLLTRRKLFELARGEWIVCVDSDDYIAENALERIKNAFVLYHADMVMFNLVCTQVDGHQEVFCPSLMPNYVYNNTQRKDIYDALAKNKYINSLCTKAFKRTIVDTDVDYKKWKDLKIGEDLFQSYPLWDNCGRIVYINETLYFYRKNEKSITSQIPLDFYKRRKILWERDDYYAKKWGANEEAVNCVLKQRVSEIMDYIRSVCSRKTTPDVISYLREIKEDGILTKYNSLIPHRMNLRDRILMKLIMNGKEKSLLFCCRAEKKAKIIIKKIRNK